MTTADLKKAVDAMTTEERLFVLAYLQHLSRVDDPLRQAQLGERMRRMDSGRKVTLDQAQRLHEALESEGL